MGITCRINSFRRFGGTCFHLRVDWSWFSWSWGSCTSIHMNDQPEDGGRTIVWKTLVFWTVVVCCNGVKVWDLRFLQRRWWIFRSYVMWCCIVDWEIVTDVLEEHVTLTRHGVMSQQSLNLRSKFCRNFDTLMLGVMRSCTLKMYSRVKCKINMTMTKKMLSSGMRFVVFWGICWQVFLPEHGSSMSLLSIHKFLQVTQCNLAEDGDRKNI